MSKTQTLPARPNLDYLRKLAKKRVAASRKSGDRITIAQAQLAIAREFGFPSWRKLKTYIDQLANADRAINLPHVFRDLMKAIVRRNDEEMTRLLAKAPEVVNRNGPHPEWGGRPQPLHVAIETGNRRAFDALLNAGADINTDSKDYDRWTPLMLAIHWKRHAMRDELLRRNAHVDLIAALMLKDDRRVARLLKNPSALTGPFPNDATPLHFARTLKSARRLIQLGVDPAAKNKYGKTAMQVWATAKPRSAGLMRLAKSLGETPALDLSKAVEQSRLTLVRKMLVRGADVNSRSGFNRATLLHAAAWNGDLAIAKLLVAHGADVHALDEEHKATAAQFARHALKVFDRQPCKAVAEYLEELIQRS